MSAERVKPYPWCFLGLCGHRMAEDETGCWGQCDCCGNRAGFVSRADLRRYADRVVEAEPARRPPAGDRS